MLGKRENQSTLNTILLERGGRYYFVDPASSVIASGSTVAQAYEKFAQARTDLLGEVERAGLSLSDVVSRPTEVATRPGFGRELALFVAKFCVALVIVGAVGLPVAATIARGVSDALSAAAASIQPISLVDVAQKAADIARDAEELPPEKKESLRRSIAIIRRELGPVVDALSEPVQPPPASNR